MPEIKRASVDDLDAVAPLFMAYRRFYGRTSSHEEARAFLRERLERGESVVLLAELDAEPVGFTQLYPLLSSVGMNRIWILNDLYVVESARRCGVANALLQAARRHGEETGAGGLMLQTGRDNRAAQALYEREGWRRENAYYWYGLDLAPLRQR